jgi:hypothetical protein
MFNDIWVEHSTIIDKWAEDWMLILSTPAIRALYASLNNSHPFKSVTMFIDGKDFITVLSDLTNQKKDNELLPDELEYQERHQGFRSKQETQRNTSIVQTFARFSPHYNIRTKKLKRNSSKSNLLVCCLLYLMKRRDFQTCLLIFTSNWKFRVSCLRR